MHTHRESALSNLLSSLEDKTTGRQALFKLNRNFLHRILADQPLLDADGILQYNPSSKVELFADVIEDQFKPVNIILDNDVKVREIVDRFDARQSSQNAIFFSG